VVRLASVQPLQAAVERLISLAEKWEPGSKPTNREESWYNPEDEIVVVVSLSAQDPRGQLSRLCL